MVGLEFIHFQTYQEFGVGEVWRTRHQCIETNAAAIKAMREAEVVAVARCI